MSQVANQATAFLSFQSMGYLLKHRIFAFGGPSSTLSNNFFNCCFEIVFFNLSSQGVLQKLQIKTYSNALSGSQKAGSTMIENACCTVDTGKSSQWQLLSTQKCLCRNVCHFLRIKIAKKLGNQDLQVILNSLKVTFVVVVVMECFSEFQILMHERVALLPEFVRKIETRLTSYRSLQLSFLLHVQHFPLVPFFLQQKALKICFFPDISSRDIFDSRTIVQLGVKWPNQFPYKVVRYELAAKIE